MRRGALGAGAAALAAAVFIPDRPLSTHMVQHLVLTMVAAPLIAAGAPVRTALRVLPRGGRRALGRVLAGRVLGGLSRPVVAVGLFVGAMLLTHLTGFYDAAERHEGLHAIEHALYLGTALLFWMPLVGVDPSPHRVGWLGRALALLVAMTAMSFVGIALVQTHVVRYASYAGPGALADQHRAGTIMWLGGSLAGALLVLAVAWAALTGEERRQRARDAYADAELAA